MVSAAQRGERGGDGPLPAEQVGHGHERHPGGVEGAGGGLVGQVVARQVGVVTVVSHDLQEHGSRGMRRGR